MSLSLAACSAGAADLGTLRVLSASGDPLRAEIEITSYTPEEAGTLQVKLASPDIYRQSQVDYQPVLSGLQLSVEDRANGRKVIQVSSTAPVDARVLDLLVDLTWNMGRFIRQYSFVLNTPVGEVRAPVVAAEAVPPLQVGPGETLFDIARRVQPEGATVFQTLLALFNANPHAFINGNMNQLMAGAMLNVPGPQAVLAENDAQARRSLLSQGEAFTLYRERLAQAASGATPVASRGAPAQSAGAIESTTPEPAPAETKGDELKLSNDGTAQSDAANSQAVRDRLEEEKSATERAIQESESRVKELQENVTAMRSLLESQNQALAGMEQRAGNEPVPAAEPAPAADPVAEKPPSEPVSNGYAEWVNDRVVAVFGGVLAVLAVILSVLALRRRGREETVFDPGFGADDDLAVPSPAPALAAAPVAAAAYDEDDDEYGDDEGPMNPPAGPIAPIAFGFDLDLDKPPSDEPPVATSSLTGVRDKMTAPAEQAEPVVAGPTPIAPTSQVAPQQPVTAPVAPEIILPASEPLSPPITPVAVAPVVTPPATPSILPEPAPALPSGLKLDTDIGGLPDNMASKLDLAKAYIDIGDRAGARELLNEVVNTGDVQQRHRARDLLATL